MGVDDSAEWLLGEIVSGRREPTGEDYRRISAELCGYLRGRFANSPLQREDFEEAAADAFRQLLATKEPARDPLAWLKHAAKARALDLLRKITVRPARPVEGDDRVFERADEAPSPQEQLEQREQLARLRVVIAGLPRKLRAALHASDLIAARELTVAEACEHLGVPRSTFHDQVKRATRELQRGLSGRRNGPLAPGDPGR